MKSIATALSALAAEIHNPQKTASNPHFRSNFAPLDEILAYARPLLAKHGLVAHQGAASIDGGWSLRTTILHTSGEAITSDYPLQPAKPDPQGVAAAVTYARRYALCAALGIAGTDDDDGEAACGRPAPAQPRGSDQRSQNDWHPEPARQTTPRPSASDLQKAYEKAKQATDPKQAFACLATAAGCDLKSLADVPADKTAACITALNNLAGVPA